MAGSARPFLRMPPFPGARLDAVPALVDTAQQPFATFDALDLAGRLAAARVGGSFWAAQPDLPAGRDYLLVPDDAAQARGMQDRAAAQGEAARCVLIGPYAGRHGIPVVSDLCDPWFVAERMDRVVAGGASDFAPVAAFLGRAVEIVGPGPWAGLTAPADFAGVIAAQRPLVDPFTGQAIAPSDWIALLADWRQLIDANRAIAAIYGVARWKQVTANALLWDGGQGPRHANARSWSRRELTAQTQAIAWKSRSPAGLVDALTARGVPVGEVEDGFIRSTGLGANCVPPLSIIVDFAGIYFDPTAPSDLERILADVDMAPALLTRAAALRARLIAAGIAKYGRATGVVAVTSGQQRRILVPGQVADDRSVQSGGGGLGNLDLLRRARELEPDAFLIYKPHPDVEAGHRQGAIPDHVSLAYADEIDRTSPIAPLIDSVDAVHTLTSLAGFEALMRGKAVTTHGVPFYAGWGLTRDLGAVPARRGRPRSLDELVAATLILYPRYLDPVTRLPCPVEVLVDRLESDRAAVTSPLVLLREVQGRISTMARRIRGRP